MLKDIGSQLTEIIEQKRLKKEFENDLQLAEKEHQDKSSELALLNATLKKQNAIVGMLGKKGILFFIHSILGDRDQKLEQESQKLLPIQFHSEQVKHQVSYLEEVINSLTLKLKGLVNIDEQYRILLSKKEQVLLQTNEPVAKEIMTMSEKIGELNSKIREIHEAISAGQDAISSLDRVIELLESAEGWGTFDMLGGGFLASSIKHSRIDEAREGIHQVHEKMSQFQRELADVRNNIELDLEIDGLMKFTDLLFDGFIGFLIDSVVQSKISDALEKTKQAKKTISDVIKVLTRQEEDCRFQADELRKKGISLIEHSQ